jgi:hypothetical protein
MNLKTKIDSLASIAQQEATSCEKRRKAQPRLLIVAIGIGLMLSDRVPTFGPKAV